MKLSHSAERVSKGLFDLELKKCSKSQGVEGCSEHSMFLVVPRLIAQGQRRRTFVCFQRIERGERIANFQTKRVYRSSWEAIMTLVVKRSFVRWKKSSAVHLLVPEACEN